MISFRATRPPRRALATISHAWAANASWPMKADFGTRPGWFQNPCPFFCITLSHPGQRPGVDIQEWGKKGWPQVERERPEKTKINADTSESRLPDETSEDTEGRDRGRSGLEILTVPMASLTASLEQLSRTRVFGTQLLEWNSNSQHVTKDR